jgi:Poxvirus Late Transcription Factor VLTF3 like
VYDRILLEINKQRITNMAEMTPARIKNILKVLRLNKFYEHTPHILLRISGCPTPNFSVEVEDKLRQMFKMIQVPFLKHSPKGRKNFLSYSYTIHKCLQLLELDEYLQYFPLLRSREKTFVMDTIWQKICNELGWKFYRSL